MRNWITAADLAGMPGMPGTARSVLRRAESEGWTSRPRDHGKGYEYHIDSLPAETQAHLRSTHISCDDGAAVGRNLAVTQALDDRITQRNRQAGLRDFMALDDRARSRADARIFILAALDAYTRSSHLAASKALISFCAAYNAGDLALESWVHELVTDVHPATIYRWRNSLATEGAAALAGRYGRNKKSLVDTQPDLQRFVVAMLTDYPHASTAHIMQACRARFSGSDVRLPSDRRMGEWVNTWRQDNRQLITAVANPDAWKNKFMSAQGSASAEIHRLNQRWEADSTPADVELVDGRHCIIGVIDVWSRRPMLLVSKTSKASAVALLLRQALLAWGVPESVKTDNGSDYTSLHIRRVFQSIGIDHPTCQPFAGWEKPHIERFFKTFSHSLVELLPNYIGHNVAERQELRARQSFADRLFKRGESVRIEMTAIELQDFCNRWIDSVYMHAKHSGLGKSPFAAVAEWRGGIKMIDDERALDVLLAEAPGNGGMRTVTKKGLAIDGIEYIAPELGTLVGERVHIRFAEDIGQVYVFHNGEFSCIAEAPAYTGVNRQEIAAQARQRQKSRMQAARAALKAAARGEKTKDIADEILSQRSGDTASLVHLPHRKTTHTTDDIAAAIEAAARMDSPTAEYTPVTDEAQARVADLMRREQQADETAEDRFRRWIGMDRKHKAGEQLAETERAWLRRYETTSEFAARKDIYDQFGASAFGIA